MWQHGAIYGFITKEECLEVLKNAKEGTFIIRFSESQGGAFAISYVSTDANNRIKHYLVKAEEVVVTKTLPDYVEERLQFQTFLIINPETKALHPVDKAEALKIYPKKGKPAKPTQGYITVSDVMHD